jgi:hypothetical protein
MNITLITDVLPDDNFTAGQVLRNMLRNLNAESVSVLWINQSHLERAPDDPLYTVSKEYRFAFKGWPGPALHRLIHKFGPASTLSSGIQLILTFWFCVRIAISIRSIRTRKSREDYLWLVLQGEKLLLIYMLLALFDFRRIILHQWDPLSWWMGHRNHRPDVIRLMSRGLEWLQKRVWLNIVPSLPWEAKLRAAGCRAVRVCHFFPEQELALPSAAIRLHTPGKLNVVFIGQFYAGAELDACLSVLNRNAAGLGLRLVLHYFGSGTPAGRTDIEIVSHGYRPRMEMITCIAKWDLALLPYPCEPQYAQTAELSFPSKSRIYAAAGLPIVSYAPLPSSVEQFFAQHYMPYYINARHNEDLRQFITESVDIRPAPVQRRRAHTQSVVKRWFSADAEIGNLIHLLRA